LQPAAARRQLAHWLAPRQAPAGALASTTAGAVALNQQLGRH